jgi:hypothetical protein
MAFSKKKIQSSAGIFNYWPTAQIEISAAQTSFDIQQFFVIVDVFFSFDQNAA